MLRAVIALAVVLALPARADEADDAEPLAVTALGKARTSPIEGKSLVLDGKTLEFVGQVLEIKDIASAIAGAATGIEGAPNAIQANLKDLRAKVTETEIRIELSGDVLFDFDKHTLRKDALGSLEKLGQVVKGYGGKGQITVIAITPHP